MFHQVLIALPQKRTRSEFLSQKKEGRKWTVRTWSTFDSSLNKIAIWFSDIFIVKIFKLKIVSQFYSFLICVFISFSSFIEHLPESPNNDKNLFRLLLKYLVPFSYFSIFFPLNKHLIVIKKLINLTIFLL